jgi:hypothetical protein
MIHAHDEELGRTLKLSKTNTMTSTEFTNSATDRANKILAFDSSGEISVTQELGTYKGTSATTTTAAFVQRDIVKGSTTAQLNNIYICVADSAVGDTLTDTDHFALLVDAVAAATSATAAASSATASASSASTASGHKDTASGHKDTATAQATIATNKAADAGKYAVTVEDSQFTLSDGSTTGYSALHYAAKAAASATSAASSLSTFTGQYHGSASSDPSSGLNAGDLYFNSSNNVMMVYNGSAWQSTTPSSSNQTNINALAASAVITDMSMLATTAIIEDLSLLAVSTVIDDMALLATSAVIEDMGLLGVASVIEDMGILATSANVTNMATLGASGVVTNIATVAGSVSNVNTVASNISSVNDFAAKYRIGSSDPSSSLDTGDLFYNTSSNQMKVYSGSAWVAGVLAGSGFAATSNNLSDMANVGTALSNLGGMPLTGGTFTGDVAAKTSDGALLKLQTSDTTVADGDVIGAIEFSAPNEASGTDAITTAVSIVAEADDTFAADNNATDLVVKLGESGAATEKMRLHHQGHLTLTSDDGSGSNVRPSLILDRVSASPADNDFLGQVSFKGTNDADETINYGTIRVRSTDVSDSSEDSQMQIRTFKDGSGANSVIIENDTTTFNGGIVIANAGTIGSASDTDALAISSGGVVNFTQQPTVSSSALKVAGKETMWVPAAAMYPETTNGCAALAQVELSNGPELKCLDFDASSDEHAQFSVAFPKSWNEGTVTFSAYFTVSGTNTGNVSWALSGVSFSDNGDLNTAFGTAVAPTAKAHSGTSGDLNITAESGAVTIAGSPAAEDLCIFRIMRDVSADDQSGDARLLGIKLFFTTDAANDA